MKPGDAPLTWQKLISEHLVAVFSKSYCPYCKRAKQVIAGLNLESNKIGLLELDEMKEGPDVQVCFFEGADRVGLPVAEDRPAYCPEHLHQR